MTRPVMLLCVCLAAACGGDKSDDGGTTDTDADTDTDTDTAHTASTALTAHTGTTSSIPDPYAGLMPTCSTRYADMVFTNFYVGDLIVDDKAMTFSGTETMAFYPSSMLEKECSLPPTCVVVYTLSGAVVPTSQAGFDYALDGQAQIDLGATTCDSIYDQLWEDPQFTVSYAVRENKDGTSEVAFESSGSVFGGWHWEGDRLTYVSDAVCSLLPDPPYTPCPP